jgi:hypothetical protein
MPDVLQLKVGFIGLIVKALLGYFKKHNDIHSIRSCCVQAVVDAIKEGDLLIACRSLILRLLGGKEARSFHDGVVGAGYLALKGRSLLHVTINRVHRV